MCNMQFTFNNNWLQKINRNGDRFENVFIFFYVPFLRFADFFGGCIFSVFRVTSTVSSFNENDLEKAQVYLSILWHIFQCITKALCHCKIKDIHNSNNFRTQQDTHTAT